MFLTREGLECRISIPTGEKSTASRQNFCTGRAGQQDMETGTYSYSNKHVEQ